MANCENSRHIFKLNNCNCSLYCFRFTYFFQPIYIKINRNYYWGYANICVKLKSDSSNVEKVSDTNIEDIDTNMWLGEIEITIKAGFHMHGPVLQWSVLQTQILDYLFCLPFTATWKLFCPVYRSCKVWGTVQISGTNMASFWMIPDFGCSLIKSLLHLK